MEKSTLNHSMLNGVATGSLFLRADALIGPLYFGYGIADGDSRVDDLLLWQTF